MITLRNLIVLGFAVFLTSSCVVGKKKYNSLEVQKQELESRLNASQKSISDISTEKAVLENSLARKQDQLEDARLQLQDCINVRDKQLTTVGDLTVLSQSANENIRETLSQLEKKDKYIHMLQMAKSKADSINLALSVNLKQVLKDGLDDEDVEVKLDKTVVMINLSDKVLFKSGSADLSPRANEVLGKIAQIINSRPELEVMIEGYTDTDPIKNNCVRDNWDLSVRRATSVVRMFQNDFNIDPNRLIAAGRGEYNTLAPNDTPENKALNRRTRIIIMPKLNQFYDLLDSKKVPQ